MVAISLNSDLGDSWEWADDPRYPQVFRHRYRRRELRHLRDDPLMSRVKNSHHDPAVISSGVCRVFFAANKSKDLHLGCPRFRMNFERMPLTPQAL